MNDLRKTKKQTQNLPKEPITEGNIPLSHKMEVKDLVNPITLRRVRILQFSAVMLIALAGASYYWYYYVKQPSGAVVVQEWIDAAGGMEAWNKINNGTFQREHIMYSENGEVLTRKMETFFFEKVNGVYGLLTHYNTSTGTDLWMGKDKEGYWATLNDLPTDPKKAGKDLGFMCDSKWCTPDCRMKMTMYRFSMPFNLVGDGVIPSLSGISKVDDQATNVLEVSYRPTTGNDRWVLYADQQSNLISKIEYHHKSDHGNNYPEEMYWSDYREIDGVQLPHSWKRYWTNGKTLEEYTYSNFSFNSSLPEKFETRPADLDWVSLR